MINSSVKKVICDIDHVLCCQHVNTVQEVAYFKAKGAIIYAQGKQHYIFPGVKEFMRALYDEENLNVAFFSAAGSKRNNILIPKLLQLSLPKDKIAKALERTKIFSNVDMKNGIKDISVTLEEGETLENSVIIDDQLTYVGVSQFKNWIYSPPVSASNFTNLRNKIYEYSPEGLKFYKCKLTSSSEPLSTRWSINIKKVDEGFKIMHGNASYFPVETLILQENFGMIEGLNEYYESKKDALVTDTTLEIDNQDLIKNICLFVESNGARARKIYHQANRIFHAAGILFGALLLTQHLGINLSSAAQVLQFYANETQGYSQIFFGDETYIQGLLRFRKYSPDLQFVSPHEYVNFIYLPLTEDEQSELSEYLPIQEHISGLLI